jgi:hypothetical protein
MTGSCLRPSLPTASLGVKTFRKCASRSPGVVAVSPQAHVRRLRSSWLGRRPYAVLWFEYVQEMVVQFLVGEFGKAA